MTYDPASTSGGRWANPLAADADEKDFACLRRAHEAVASEQGSGHVGDGAA